MQKDGPLHADIELGMQKNDAYYSTLARNISHLNQLEKIIENFHKEDIEAILFKGLMLAELAYGDLGGRTGGDLDILVKKEDVIKADRILKGLDYRPPFNIKNPGQVRFSNYRNSLLYQNKDETKIPVHIYWHLINLAPYHKNVFTGIDMRKIWLEAEPIKLGDVSLHTFSRRHQVIYLSMHALKHCFYPSILLRDISEFLRRQGDGFDWESLVEESFNFGLSKAVYYSLYLARKLLDAPVPYDALSRLKPKRMSIFERKLISSVLAGRAVFTAEGLVYFGMNETWRGRVSFLHRAIFAPKQELAFIRQKGIEDIGILDYIIRTYSGFYRATQALFNWLN